MQWLAAVTVVTVAVVTDKISRKKRVFNICLKVGSVLDRVYMKWQVVQRWWLVGLTIKRSRVQLLAGRLSSDCYLDE